MANNHVDSLADLFTSRGLRCTRQRRNLFDALMATKAHPTADQLFRDVTIRCPGMSLATVYNTLEAFCNVGLARKLPSPDGSARYDATVTNHLHLRCEKTGAVADAPDDLNKQFLETVNTEVLRQIEARLGFKIREVHVELVGEFIS